MRENQKTMFIQYLPSSLAILSGTIENLLEPLESLLERCSPSPCLLTLLNSLPLSSPCFKFRRKTLEQGQRIKDRTKANLDNLRPSPWTDAISWVPLLFWKDDS